ncbi:hypothetical protein, partial [Sinorhizobium fredii]
MPNLLATEQPHNSCKPSGWHGYDDHWLEDPTRDRPLSHRWRMPQLELAKALSLPKMKTKTLTEVLHLVSADIIMSARMHPGRRVSYSRSDAFYKARRQYTPAGYNLKNVTTAIDLLEKLGYIVDHDRRPPGRRGTQSSFLPNPSLAMLLLPAVHEPPKAEIIMKDADGNVVPYEDSGRVHDKREIVRKVNEVLASAEIVLDAEGVVADGPWLRKGDYVMYPALKSLYRVFNGGWRLGGRFYGGWWQGVKSEDRKFFLLDGEKTKEVDYSQIHPRIIYAEAGIDLVGDAYDIPGYDRNLCKAAFNILVNAACYLSALGALTRDMNGDRRGAEALIEAIKARHSDVAKYFHSSAGVRLQGLDSRMAEIVLTEMTVKRGIPVLPVHDSFIVPESHRETLVRLMKDAFEKVVGKTGNRDKIVKSSVGNTSVKSSAYSDTDYKRPARAGAPRPSSPLAATSNRETDPSSAADLPVAGTVASSPNVPVVLDAVMPSEPTKPVRRTPAPDFLRRARDEAIAEWQARTNRHSC